jgi:iron complex outermembrane recepter protein
MTYFDVKYEGRIDAAQITPDVLQQPQDAWLVNRSYTAAELADACTHSVFYGAPGTCLTSQVDAILDNRLRNIALLRTRGIDAIEKYSVDTSVGKLQLGVNGTYLLEYSQAITPGSPLLNILSTQNNPINLRLRSSALWTRRGFGISSNVNFTNSYHDIQSVPNRAVNSWTTVDLQFSYETSANNLGWLGHTQFSLNAQNLFNRYPPFLNNPVGVGYDQENADLFGRIVSLDVRKHW